MEGLAGDMGEKIMREARAQQAELDQEEGSFHVAQGLGFHSEVCFALHFAFCVNIMLEGHRT
jgi:hypothetical protein